MTRTAAALRRLSRPLHRWTLASSALAAVGGGAIGLGLAAWGLRADLGVAAYWVLGAWLAAAAAGLSGLVLWYRDRRAWETRRLAAQLEALGLARRGAVVAVLDGPATGTSEALAAAADATRADLLEVEGARALAGTRRRLRGRTGRVAGAGLGGLIALTAAGPSHGRAALLWRPRAALETLLAPVRLAATPPMVDRGGSTTLALHAAGRRTATLYRRAPGESWSAAAVALDSTGRARSVVGPMETDLFFRLAAGGRESDTVHVRVRYPAFLGSIQITAEYPAYLELPSEVLPPLGEGGNEPVLLPAGTTLMTRGLASTAVARAVWRGVGSSAPLRVSGRGFEGRFTPRASGGYQLEFTTGDGRPLGSDPIRLSLALVPDSVPVVQILTPGPEAPAPADLTIPLVVEARDDHGLRTLELVVRAGGAAPAVEPLPLPPGDPDRALLPAQLDLARWRPRPGDTVRYLVRATDNSPARQVGQSREYVVVVPTDAGQREAQRAAAAGARASLDSLVAASRRLERQTEDLARTQPREQAGARPAEPALGFEEARRAQAVAEAQDRLAEQTEELRETLEALRQAAAQDALNDPDLARRLAEVSEQLGKALSPELRERLEELRRALQALDPERTRAALEQLAGAQEELRETLERSRELLRRAALEGELASLARDAQELAAAEARWTEKLDAAEAAPAAAEERNLAKRADSLAASLERAAGELGSDSAQARTAQAAGQVAQAAGGMRRAAQAAERGDRPRARAAGAEAQAALDDAARRTADERQRQQEAWREEVIQALDRAMAETARLSQQQAATADGFRRGGGGETLRREQGAIEESVQQIVEQARAIAGKNALVSPQIAAALAAARGHMARAREAVSTGTPNAQEATEAAGDAVDALNLSAFSMARARQDVAGASSGSGLAEALERMTQVAGQQGQVGQQAAGLLPQAGSAAAEGKLRRLAAAQRAVAEAMQRLRAQGQVPGAGDLANEAEELARRLEAGRLDRETVERQQRLFRRMLDAGRSLQGEETDERKERQSQTARGDQAHLPPALRRKLAGAGSELPFPTWEELRRLSPEERRLVTEYFRRLAAERVP